MVILRTRTELREWLTENHATASDCWVAVKRGRPIDDGSTFWYIDAVEEALCFGWIDAVYKNVNGELLQRFTRRRPRSQWSELNKARCRRLEELGLMTEAGRTALPKDEFIICDEIREALKCDPEVWKNFQALPDLYRKVRIDTIQIKRSQPALFASRLAKFIDNTRRGIMYGEWNDNGRLL